MVFRWVPKSLNRLDLQAFQTATRPSTYSMKHFNPTFREVFGNQALPFSKAAKRRHTNLDPGLSQRVQGAYHQQSAKPQATRIDSFNPICKLMSRTLKPCKASKRLARVPDRYEVKNLYTLKPTPPCGACRYLAV